MRMLCLHGYRGSAAILRRQMAPLAAAIGPHAELVYVDAPSLARGDFGWWHEGFSGWESTRDWAVELLSSGPPVDGIFGFSQGAALTGLLAGLRDSQPSLVQFDFAIMVGGFTSTMPKHAGLFLRKITLPSVHVTGRADTIVPSRDSLLLADRFADPLVIAHDGGHIIPGRRSATEPITSFLARFRTPEASGPSICLSLAATGAGGSPPGNGRYWDVNAVRLGVSVSFCTLRRPAMRLRYGMNPQQAAAHAAPVLPDRWPVRVLHGQPSVINLLDALGGWQLVREAGQLLDRPAAASFKHTSPAGVALAGRVDDVAAATYGRTGGAGISGVASAYLRARDADPKSSYGDFAAVSRPVDLDLADLLAGAVCDGIVAPGYEPGTVAALSRKKNGRFLIMEADPAFTPPPTESREVFGVRLTQDRDETPLSARLLQVVTGPPLTETATSDLLLGLAVLRQTQSNSVCYVRDGMTLGIGAGQQSRVDCTRLAGAKTDTWWWRRHPVIRDLRFAPGLTRQDKINWQVRLIEADLTAQEHSRLARVLTEPATELSPAQRADWGRRLTGVAFASDGHLPFRDNVDHARRHGVSRIAEPGGSVRGDQVAAACQEYGITLARTGLRLFQH